MTDKHMNHHFQDVQRQTMTAWFPRNSKLRGTRLQELSLQDRGDFNQTPIKTYAKPTPIHTALENHKNEQEEDIQVR